MTNHYLVVIREATRAVSSWWIKKT